VTLLASSNGGFVSDTFQIICNIYNNEYPVYERERLPGDNGWFSLSAGTIEHRPRAGKHDFLPNGHNHEILTSLKCVDEIIVWRSLQEHLTLKKKCWKSFYNFKMKYFVVDAKIAY